jgi:hypothetical protein
MAFTITFEAAKQRAVLTFHGPQTYADLVTVLQHLADAPERTSTLGLLWDLRDATLELRASEVYSLSLLGSRLLHASQHRIAVVVSTIAMYGIGRMAQAYAEVVRYPGAYAVFRNLAEAEIWLPGA